MKADSTLRTSRAVHHPGTNRALYRLTSEVEGDPVHSTRYGRQRKQPQQPVTPKAAKTSENRVFSRRPAAAARRPLSSAGCAPETYSGRRFGIGILSRVERPRAAIANSLTASIEITITSSHSSVG
jgi:hypothetical protein